MGTLKQIDIKNRTYYFYNDVIYLESFKSKIEKNNIKTLVFTILDILRFLKLAIVKIFTV